jgi:hypothetical protein
MASVTPQIEELRSRRSLGGVQRVYGPLVPLRVLTGLVLVAVGAVWGLFTAAVVGSTIVPAGVNPFHLPAPTPGGPSFVQYLPLFGLIFVLAGVTVIIRAVWVAQSRVAACANGVAVHTRGIHDAFTWADVLTVTSRIDVTQTRATNSYSGATTTTTRIRKRFTVHCRDGRTFVLDSAMFGNRIQDLADLIQVNVARAKQTS